MPTQDDIRAAAERIAPHIRRTPVFRLEPADTGLAVPVTLKLEQLQVTGSFKPRGAFNRILSSRVPEAGVIAASGGNHGLAVAHAAQKLKLNAEIYVPGPTPEAKKKRIMDTGAWVYVGGMVYEHARLAAEERAAETGALMVHAYDQEEVLAGQGTIGMELEEQAPDLSHLLVAIGGGGLYAGIASWYRDRINMVLVEPEACPTMFVAAMTGAPTDAPTGGIAADSLGARRIGEIAFATMQEWGGNSVVLADELILKAQRWLWDRLRIVAEPGGATALAALLSGAWKPPSDAHVGVVVCGANCDPGSVVG
ncbi:threonine/serine dehydratase [Roseomonas sp. PWR1]|uniref:Threonine/serine dehydratase n=1 Tax=Roseomonas nitratireducens TaxID=2820810 RepID=A0ABS4AY59_9PROT|nr:threonine/serine dehydratase [Neoroseomonas nitratireducens]MBP0465748.1 threonine/serine dehydratase [Neoroseomonas nitratireducens]